MKALLSAISAVILLGSMAHAQDPGATSVSAVTEAPYMACGLFGPSKRELLQRLHYESQTTNATLARIEVEQARQTELLRQIAGQTQRAADNTARAAQAEEELRQHLGTLDPRTLRRGEPNIGDIRSAPDVPPTGTADPRTLQPQQPNIGNIRTAPDIEVQGPILQGTSGRVYYAKRHPATRAVPVKRGQPITRYTNYSLRN